MPSGNDYNKIASFYDDVIGTDLFGSLLKNYLNKKYRKGSKILELGCGTGINLLPLSKYFKIEGIDISEKMLKIAKKKIPGSVFYRQDIRKFSVKKKYDVILCLYDTINHIKGLKSWYSIFSKVSSHLTEEGVFIFDINTVSKLDLMSSHPASVIKFGKNFLIMSVTNTSSGNKENSYNWNMKIFEAGGKNKFSFTENNILEYAYSISEVKKELNRSFSSVKTYNSELKPTSKNSGRIFFICKNF